MRRNTSSWGTPRNHPLEFRQYAFDLLSQLVRIPAMEVVFDAVKICLGTGDYQISRIREPPALELEREQQRRFGNPSYQAFYYVERFDDAVFVEIAVRPFRIGLPTWTRP